MSDHGICAEDYCRNRVEQLTSYNDYLSNVLLIIKHQDLVGSFTKEFDTINLRKLVSDLIFDNSFSNESEYKNYDFYNKFNEAIIKIK